MKTLTILSAVAAALVFSTANAQNKKASDPQPVPMTAPAMKTQNAPQQSTQQNSQSTTAPKPSGTTTETKKADNGKAAESAAPAMDNKIAVSDPGTPGDKANTKKSPATNQPVEKKTTNPTGVSPK